MIGIDLDHIGLRRSPEMPLRLLHLAPGNLYGGVETVLATLAKHRGACAGLKQDFAVCFEGRFLRELRDLGVDPVLLGGARVSAPLTILRTRHRLKQLLKREKYDAVVCHSSWLNAMFGSTILRSSASLVFWLHNWTDGRHWLERWAARSRPATIIANSRYTATSAPSIFPGVPVTVVYNPVDRKEVLDLSARRNMREKLGVLPDEIVITQVSRMEDWKGHEFHLRALGELSGLAGWRCLMIGGSQRPKELEYVQKMKQVAASLGIADRVNFLGERTDVAELLQASDIFCQPNTGAESFGMVYVEAMGAGLPVVSTTLGAAPEVIGTKCGSLVNAGNVAQLSTVLSTLIIDWQKRKEMGDAGIARAEHLCHPADRIHDLEHVVRKAVAPKLSNRSQRATSHHELALMSGAGSETHKP